MEGMLGGGRGEFSQCWTSDLFCCKEVVCKFYQVNCLPSVKPTSERSKY